MLLTAAATLSFAVAALHTVIVFVGAPGYRYFGAGETIAQLADDGSPLPAVLTLGLAGVFTVFGLYAWSGAGHMHRLPLLRVGLVAIGVIYALRGLALVADLWALAGSLTEPALRSASFSLVSLVIGTVYLLGILREWSKLALTGDSGL